MSALKATMVRKSSSVKPAVMQDSSPQYENFESFEICDMKDPKIIRELVHQIESLDSDGHEEIYKTIRKFKPKTFFGCNSIDSRFNIDKLSIKELHALNQTIRLCKEDLERKFILEKADYIHRDRISKLDTSLIVDNPLPGYESLIGSVNPTEVEKIQEMLKMNKK